MLTTPTQEPALNTGSLLEWQTVNTAIYCLDFTTNMTQQSTPKQADFIYGTSYQADIPVK